MASGGGLSKTSDKVWVEELFLVCPIIHGTSCVRHNRNLIKYSSCRMSCNIPTLTVCNSLKVILLKQASQQISNYENNGFLVCVIISLRFILFPHTRELVGIGVWNLYCVRIAFGCYIDITKWNGLWLLSSSNSCRRIIQLSNKRNERDISGTFLVSVQVRILWLSSRLVREQINRHW